MHNFIESTNPDSPDYRRYIRSASPPRSGPLRSASPPIRGRPLPPLLDNAYLSRMPYDVTYNIMDIHFLKLMEDYNNTSNKFEIIYKYMLDLKITLGRTGRDIDLNRYKLKKYGPIDSVRYITDESYRDQETINKNRIPWLISLDLSISQDLRWQLGSSAPSDINEAEICNFLENNSIYEVNLKNRPLSTIKIKDVNTLNLSRTGVVDVSALGRVHTLDLSYTEVEDVRALGRVHTLNLSRCPRVTDVSALGGVHTLNLSSCRNVMDVRALGRVHSLDLSDCPRVWDMSALGGVHTLNLENCENLTDVSALSGVYYLNVHNCMNIDDYNPIRGVRCIGIGCNGARPCKLIKFYD